MKYRNSIVVGKSVYGNYEKCASFIATGKYIRSITALQTVHIIYTDFLRSLFYMIG
jgi:hypothetical protein